MSISVKRILHPVGHGAFFTEQFIVDRKTVYNVVYDCGVGYAGKFVLQEEIDRTFEKSTRSTVDYIFISHLDEDHVNGIGYMIRKGYITKETTFVLPLIPNKHLNLYSFFENRYAHLGLEMILQSPAGTIYYIEPYRNLEKDDEGRIIRMGMDDQERSGDVTVNGRREVRVPSGTRFVYEKIWEYIPFNLHDSASKDFMDAIDDSDVMDVSDLDMIQNIIYNKMLGSQKDVTDEQIRAIEKYNELRKIYNKVGPWRKGDRRININSLIVISQGVADFSTLFCFLTLPQIPQGFTKTVIGKGACVYTGDSNFAEDKDFNLFVRILCQWLREGPDRALVQIPHHGSSTSYNDGFALKHFGICFVNFNSKRSGFDWNIQYDFFCARKPLMAVTEVESSRFVERMYLR